MGGGGDVADQIQYGTAADGDDVGVAIDAELDQPALQALDQLRIVLHRFAPRHSLGRGHQLQPLSVVLRVRCDIADQIGTIRGDVLVDERDEAMPLVGLVARQRFAESRVVGSEQTLGEVNGILVFDREALMMHALKLR